MSSAGGSSSPEELGVREYHDPQQSTRYAVTALRSTELWYGILLYTVIEVAISDRPGPVDSYSPSAFRLACIAFPSSKTSAMLVSVYPRKSAHEGSEPFTFTSRSSALRMTLWALCFAGRAWRDTALQPSKTGFAASESCRMPLRHLNLHKV